MKTVKRILKIFYSVLFVVFIIIAFFVILTTTNLVKGYNFYVVMSGSMEPAIKTGSIVGTKEKDEYTKGDVITVMVNNDPNNTYTHRIVEIKEDSYITKGDANEDNDADPAFKDSILGSVFISIPLMGYIVNFAKQPTGFLLMVIVPAVIIIALEINNVKESAQSIIEKKKEKDINSKEKKDEEI